MKVVLAGVAFAALMTSPLFAQPQSVEKPLYNSRAYLAQKTQSRMDARAFDGAAWSSRATPNPDPMKQWPCSTAPSFCPDYHGDNGG
jgi:hypothetical protein